LNHILPKTSILNLFFNTLTLNILNKYAG